MAPIIRRCFGLAKKTTRRVGGLSQSNLALADRRFQASLGLKIACRQMLATLDTRLGTTRASAEACKVDSFTTTIPHLHSVLLESVWLDQECRTGDYLELKMNKAPSLNHILGNVVECKAIRQVISVR